MGGSWSEWGHLGLIVSPALLLQNNPHKGGT